MSFMEFRRAIAVMSLVFFIPVKTWAGPPPGEFLLKKWLEKRSTTISKSTKINSMQCVLQGPLLDLPMGTKLSWSRSSTNRAFQFCAETTEARWCKVHPTEQSAMVSPVNIMLYADTWPLLQSSLVSAGFTVDMAKDKSSIAKLDRIYWAIGSTSFPRKELLMARDSDAWAGIRIRQNTEDSWSLIWNLKASVGSLIELVFFQRSDQTVKCISNTHIEIRETTEDFPENRATILRSLGLLGL